MNSLVQRQVTLLERYHAREFAVAEQAATALTRDYPEDPLGWKVLGLVLLTMGRFDQAVKILQESVRVAPADAEAYCNLGVALDKLGRLDLAEENYARAIAVQADFALAHNNLGNLKKESGRLHDAVICYEKAIACEPQCAEAYINLGSVLKDLGRLEESERSYMYAQSLLPNSAVLQVNLASTLQALGKFDEGITATERAIAVEPRLASAHNNKGSVLTDLGRFEEAVSCFKSALSLAPSSTKARHNLLFALNYDPALTAAQIYREYETHGAYLSSMATRRFDHARPRRPQVSSRRPRVGYSSPDFRGHACRFFMEPIFQNHDRDQFEIFAYSNTSSTDQHTERMKGYFDHWIDVVGMTDEEMAQRIYDDQIDILVDMAGHTKGNRLPVFAMRPAPIQASSWIGFGYTTGLKEIDYFICDKNVVPEGSECYFSEEPWRLPAPGYAYEPPAEVTPEVSELPALRNGYVTFGSLTRTVRINDPLLRVWGEILERVPNSRLRLDQKPFAHEGMRELFWKRLEGLGLPRERVELTCSSPHWHAYHDIDITLDCWPHNAGTTTLESLWMGVPVLSKMDRPSMGCIGAAALKPLGLDDWLVESEEAFVERAVVAASDLESLSRLRSGLRERLEQGPHLDASTITGHLENAYRQMVGVEAH